MCNPRILRKRFIPDEIVDISGDRILYRDDVLLVTAWKAIKARKDIFGGISFAFLDQGYKISRFYDAAGRFLYWYCDILEVTYQPDTDTYLLTDLLVDVKLTVQGELQVLDADELAEALETGMITAAQAADALRKLNSVLRMVYTGQFPPAVCQKPEYAFDI